MVIKRVASSERQIEIAEKKQTHAVLARYSAMTLEQLEAEIARMTAPQREAALAGVIFALTRRGKTAP